MSETFENMRPRRQNRKPKLAVPFYLALGACLCASLQAQSPDHPVGQSPTAGFTTHNSIVSKAATFLALGDLPGGTFESLALGVSADGSVVVGSGTSAAGKQAFRWSESDGMVALGNPGKVFGQTWAIAASADGSVIVGYGEADAPDWDHHKAFIWTKSSGLHLLATSKKSQRSEAWGVSADGKVVAGDDGEQAFRWDDKNGSVELGILPGRSNSRAIAISTDGSVITGSSYNLPSWDKQEAFVWTREAGIQGLGLLPGGSWSFPNAISPDGFVIAGTADSSSGTSAFRWTRKSGLVRIGQLPEATMTHPASVSADGKVIVGGSYVDRDHATAFIWDEKHGIRSLQAVLEAEYGLKLTGWHLQTASGITPDASAIVGSGTNPAGQQEAFRVVLVSGATYAK